MIKNKTDSENLDIKLPNEQMLIHSAIGSNDGENTKDTILDILSGKEIGNKPKKGSE